MLSRLGRLQTIVLKHNTSFQDLKMENVVLVDAEADTVKIIDFGMAKSVKAGNACQVSMTA